MYKKDKKDKTKGERKMRTEHGFSISIGNRKLGAIHSFSTMPGRTCAEGVPCSHDCYARKALRLYPQSKEAWKDNTDLLMEGKWDEFVEDLVDHINFNEGAGALRYFRFAVAGDIFSVDYWKAIAKIARRCKGTKFWVYTKQFGILKEFVKDNRVPKNLCIILSVWKDYQPDGELTKLFATAWYADKEAVYPADGLICPGSCRNCKACSKLRAGSAVVFPKH